MLNVQALLPSSIVSVYSGKAHKCCCGCAGKHSYASALRAEGSKRRGYVVKDDEINDRMVTKVLRLIQANEETVEAQDDYVFVVVGNRQYVAYLAASAVAS